MANQEIKTVLLSHAFGFIDIECVVFHISASNVRSQKKPLKKIGAPCSHQGWCRFSQGTPIEHSVYYLLEISMKCLKVIEKQGKIEYNVE